MGAAIFLVPHFTEGQTEKALREVFRVLRPGGRFLFTYHIGKGTIHLDEYLGKKVDIDFMFFSREFILSCLQEIGFVNTEIIEREPYPEIEYHSRRAYVFVSKPLNLSRLKVARFLIHRSPLSRESYKSSTGYLRSSYGSFFLSR